MSDIKYISAEEAAVMLQVNIRTVLRYCSNGMLEGAVKGNLSWKIPYVSVLELQSEKRQRKSAKNYTLMERRKFAVGSSDFKEIVKRYYFVDKSLLIRDIIDDGSKVLMFTRPRRFGKSLAMDMVKTYFERTDQDNSVYFDQLAIWRCGIKYKQLQGKYPVIYINLKDTKFSSWGSALKSLAFIMQAEYARHKELEDSPLLKNYEQDYYNKIVNLEADKDILVRSLAKLCELLHKIYQKQVVVIIDEYDTPIQSGYMHGYYDEIIEFMRNWLSGGLKDNSSLYKAIMTGILRVAKENLFSDLNNVKVNTVLDEEYSQYFGFTRQDIEEIAQYYESDNKLQEICDWYDGYLFGATEIFNPWSVTNYFAQGCKPASYWVNTSENAILHSILPTLDTLTAKQLTDLLLCKSVVAKIDFNIIYPQIKENADSVYSFLLLAGYLRPAKLAEETEYGLYCSLSLPNREIKRVYKQEIINWLEDHIDYSVTSQLAKALYLNDAAMLQDELQRFLLCTVSFFDTAKESFYHGLVLGLTAVMSEKYYIHSNRESGFGRFDLALEPKAALAELPGIIIEFKVSTSDNDEVLDKLAADALYQIEEKAYYQELREHGIEKIFMLGISFAGKMCCVKHKLEGV